MLLQSLETPANLPFASELWMADASPLLAQVDIPVLVIIGKKDIQVDWQDDGEPLQRAAAGHANVTFLFPENANHVLKYEARPRAELAQPEALPRYNAPDAHLDPEALAQHPGMAGCSIDGMSRVGSRPADQRERDGECRPSAGRALDRDSAAVRLDDPL